MSPQEAARVVAFLIASFPTSKLDRDQVEAYALQIADLELAEAEQTARELALTARWFPSVAEFRETAIRRRLRLPTDAEALAQVDARLRDPDGSPDLHPTVRDALRLIGGLWSLRHADRPGAWRSQFRDIYSDLAGRELRRASLEAAGVPLDYRDRGELGEGPVKGVVDATGDSLTM